MAAASLPELRRIRAPGCSGPTPPPPLMVSACDRPVFFLAMERLGRFELPVPGRQAQPGRPRHRPRSRGPRGRHHRARRGRSLHLLRARRCPSTQPRIPPVPGVSARPSRRGRRRRRRARRPDGRHTARRGHGRAHRVERAEARRARARPPGRPSGPPPAVVLCHGYPSATESALTTPELADRIATEMGWLGLAFAFAVAATPRASSRWSVGSTTSALRCPTSSGSCGPWGSGSPGSAPAGRCRCAPPPGTSGPGRGGGGGAGRLRRLGRSSPPPARARPRGRGDHRPGVPARVRRLGAGAREVRAVACASQCARVRCWWSTAARTRPCRRSTPVSWPTPTARPSCASSTAPATSCATTPGGGRPPRLAGPPTQQPAPLAGVGAGRAAGDSPRRGDHDARGRARRWRSPTRRP